MARAVRVPASHVGEKPHRDSDRRPALRGLAFTLRQSVKNFVLKVDISPASNLPVTRFVTYCWQGIRGPRERTIYRLADGESEDLEARPTIRVPMRLLAQHATLALERRAPCDRARWPAYRVRQEVVRRHRRRGRPSRRDATRAAPYERSRGLCNVGSIPYDAGGYFELTLGMIQRTYGHHHPDHLAGVGEALTRSGIESLGGRDRYGTAER